MPGLYVCPHCGSRKISKESEDSQYCCDDCLEFFDDPKEIFTSKINIKKIESKNGGKPMPKATIDAQKIKDLVAQDKSFPEIVKETGYNKNSIRSLMKREGLKCTKDGRGGNRRSKKLSPEKVEKKVIPFFPHKDPDKITALDMLIAERNGYQDQIFKLNKAIEILSA